MTAPIVNNYLPQNVNNAKMEKSCLKYRIVPDGIVKQI